MPVTSSTATPPAPPAGQGSTAQGGNGDGAPARTYTQEELDAKLRGKGSEVERLAATAEALAKKLAAFEGEAKEREAKALADQGKFKELWEKDAAAKKAAEDELVALKGREAKRIERLTAANKERRKALPEHLQKIPANPDPEVDAEALAALEALIPEAQGAGVFGRTPRSAGPPATLEQQLEEGNKILGNAMMGRLPANARGVQK